MTFTTSEALSATDIVQAVFCSSLVMLSNDCDETTQREATQLALADVDAALQAMGITFAEYLDRVRTRPQVTIQAVGQRWRFSSRERALQQLDHKMVELCRIIQLSHAH